MKRPPPPSRTTMIGYHRGHHHALAGILMAALALPLAGAPPAQERPWPPAAEPVPIQAGEAHSWTFDMAAGDFFGAVVDQQGVDVVVEVFDETGTLILDAD
ncbi:MAG: hypothetical protein ABUL63_01315, partial [Acidobacteriota bacterium]